MNTDTQSTDLPPIRIGLIATSDRASQGIYKDEGIPALRDWLSRAIRNPITWFERLIPDDQITIEQTLIELSDEMACELIFTTGGTGPAPRDVTPEATLAVAEREMMGFGEQMRQISLHYVPTAILSRQTAVIRGNSLIVNLPGRPKSIAETLSGVRDADNAVVVHGIFSAIPYCIELMGGAVIESDADFAPAFRPKK
ncbi:MAG: molybdopterin adenylyltransferase [Formosimonas sp.]|jgi:molybdopterin adenylyltransferase